jgi:hypothetical protein
MFGRKFLHLMLQFNNNDMALRRPKARLRLDAFDGTP